MPGTRKTQTLSLNEVREMCEQKAVVDLRPALKIFGISEQSGYRMAKYCPDELPFKVLRVGSRYKVPSTSLLAVLGLSTETDHELQISA